MPTKPKSQTPESQRKEMTDMPRKQESQEAAKATQATEAGKEQVTTMPKGQTTFEKMRAAGASKSATMIALCQELGSVSATRDVFVANGVNVSYNFVYNVCSKAGIITKTTKTW